MNHHDYRLPEREREKRSSSISASFCHSCTRIYTRHSAASIKRDVTDLKLVVVSEFAECLCFLWSATVNFLTNITAFIKDLNGLEDEVMPR